MARNYLILLLINPRGTKPAAETGWAKSAHLKHHLKREERSERGCEGVGKTQLAHGKGSPHTDSQAKPVRVASSLGKRMNSPAFWNTLKLNEKLQRGYRQANKVAGDCLAGSER